MDCRQCERDDLTPKFEVPFDVKSGRQTKFGSVHTCNRCGLNLIHPQPQATEVPTHYELPKYYTHGASHIPERSPTAFDRIITHLAWRTDRGAGLDPSELAGDQARGQRMLDIGCGAGKLMSAFAERGMETVGVDPDPAARLEAEGSGHVALPGAAEELPAELAGQKFDVVTMTHVLEHCLSPHTALSNARELLSETGVLYCEVPNAGSAYFRTYGQISEMLDVPRHLFFFDKTNLENLAAEAGLEITGWKFHGLTRHFSASWKGWENSIFDRLEDAGAEITCKRRSALGDVMLLATGLFQARDRRYDSIGFTARAQ